jgi:hypothetical protein
VTVPKNSIIEIRPKRRFRSSRSEGTTLSTVNRNVSARPRSSHSVPRGSSGQSRSTNGAAKNTIAKTANDSPSWNQNTVESSRWFGVSFFCTSDGPSPTSPNTTKNAIENCTMANTP